MDAYHYCCHLSPLMLQIPHARQDQNQADESQLVSCCCSQHSPYSYSTVLFWCAMSTTDAEIKAPFLRIQYYQRFLLFCLECLGIWLYFCLLPGIIFYLLISNFLFHSTFFLCHPRQTGVGIAQWLEHRTRDWKVAGSNPCWNGGRIFFSRVDFLCWLLFRYPFHPRVTTVARKKSRSFCQKCRWQVTAEHAYTLRMWILLNRASALVTTCP